MPTRKKKFIGKRKKTGRYYDISAIDSTGADYRIIYGERSSGKTYQALKKVLEEYIKTGRPSVYARQQDSNFKYQDMKELFTGLTSNESGENVLLDISNGVYDSIIYSAKRWYLAKSYYDDDGEIKYEKNDDPFMYGIDLWSAISKKGPQYGPVKYYILDEFLNKDGYIADEFSKFLNSISTVKRNRNDLIIYMLGNTVTRFCPYFKEMGLKHIYDQEQGTIDVYEYTTKVPGVTMTVAVEYCDQHEVTKESEIADRYFAFDNEDAKMITSGSWSFDTYPTLENQNITYKRDDIVIEFYIHFDDRIFEGDVIIQDDNEFCFIHEKFDHLYHDEDYLHYDLEESVKRNYSSNIMKPRNGVEQRIAYFFKVNKVFYSTREVGDMIFNFLNGCK